MQTIPAPARMLSKPTQDLRTSQTQGQPVLVTEFGHINLLAAKWKQCGNYGTGPIAPKALPTLEQCSEHNSVQGATSCYLDWALFSSIQDISIVVLAASAAKRRSHKYLYYGSPDTLSDRPRCVLWLSW